MTAEPAPLASDPVTSRRDSILVAARAVFVRDGYANFSMRGVAKEIGISLGHLQHFFPTKVVLLLEILQFTTDSYLAAYDDFVRSLPGTPVEQFRRVVRYLLEDAGNTELSAFFIEFWAVTLRDTSARNLLHRTYQRNKDDFSRFIAAMCPHLPPSTVDSMALQIIALVDGVIIYNHTASPSAEEFQRVTIAVAETIHKVVGTPGDTAP